GWLTIIGHVYVNGVVPRTLVLGRSPGKIARCCDGSACRRIHEVESERLAGIGIRGSNFKGQRLQFVDRLVSDRVDHWRLVGRLRVVRLARTGETQRLAREWIAVVRGTVGEIRPAHGIIQIIDQERRAVLQPRERNDAVGLGETEVRVWNSSSILSDFAVGPDKEE